MTQSGRLIQPPPRSSLFGTVLILLTVILLSIIPFSLRISFWVVALAVLLSGAAVLSREIQALHLAFFTALLTGIPGLYPLFRHWPLNFLLPVILYSAVVLSARRLRKSLLWLKTGRITKEVVLPMIAVAAVSGIALFIWYRALKPDLSFHLSYLPSIPALLLPFAGAAFAAGNAAMEEFMFRGVVMQATDSAFGPGLLSILVQAWLFGAMHYLQGFPNGWWGLVMTFVYGVMLGIIRRRAQGMLAPWLAHVCADLVIFVIIASVA